MLLRFQVKSGKRQELLEFLEWDAKVAREQEPGTLRFDVYASENDPNTVFLYEAYQDDDAFEEHKANEPFQNFRSVRQACVESIEVLIGGASPSATNVGDH